MTATAFAALSLTVLVLLNRIGMLHEQISQMRRERPPVPAPREIVRVVPQPPELPASPPPAPRVEEAPTIPPAPAPAEEPTVDLPTVMSDFNDAIQLSSGDPLDQLGLSDYQRARIEEHKRIREAAAQALGNIDDQYEAAVLAELSADQRKKYDESKGNAIWVNGAGAKLAVSFYRAVVADKANP